MRFKLLHVMPHVWFYKQKDTASNANGESESAGFVYKRSTSLKLVKSEGTEVSTRCSSEGGEGSVQSAKGRPAGIQVCTVVDAGCTCRATVTSHHKKKQPGGSQAGRLGVRWSLVGRGRATPRYGMVSRLACRSSKEDVVWDSTCNGEHPAKHGNAREGKGRGSGELPIIAAGEAAGLDNAGTRNGDEQGLSLQEGRRRRKMLKKEALSNSMVTSSNTGSCTGESAANLEAGFVGRSRSLSRIVMPRYSSLDTIAMDGGASPTSSRWLEEELKHLKLAAADGTRGGGIPDTGGARNMSLAHLRAALVHKKLAKQEKELMQIEKSGNKRCASKLQCDNTLSSSSTGDMGSDDNVEVEKTKQLPSLSEGSGRRATTKRRGTKGCEFKEQIPLDGGESYSDNDRTSAPLSPYDGGGGTSTAGPCSTSYTASPSSELGDGGSGEDPEPSTPCSIAADQYRHRRCVSAPEDDGDGGDQSDDDDDDNNDEGAAVVSSSNDDVFNSVAMVKNSFDPGRDFKESMMEMVLAKELRRPAELQQLLQCYLSLNALEYHPIILEAFQEVWSDLMETLSPT